MRYNLVAIGSEVLNVQQVKLQLSIDSDEWDSLLETYIEAARASAEHYTDRTLVQKRVTENYDAFPIGGEAIELSFAPVREIQSVQYIDEDGATQTWSASNYKADLSEGLPARITEAFDVNWPTIRDEINAVTVSYDIGPINSDDVPGTVIQGMLLEVGAYFEQRHDSVRKMPTAAENLYHKAKKTFL